MSDVLIATRNTLVTVTFGIRAGTLCSNLPTIVVACKSDPGVPLAINATTGNAMGSSFGVGLVEVTTQAQSGRQKMKLSFGWMLRAISRERSACSVRRSALPESNLACSIRIPREEAQRALDSTRQFTAGRTSIT